MTTPQEPAYPEEMQEVVDDFITETEELLTNLDHDLVVLEKNPEDFDLLNQIFRSVHTIKGAAGFLGFNNLVELVHQSENLLNKLRQGEMAVTPLINDVILQSADHIKTIIETIKEHKNDHLDVSSVLAKLGNILSGNAESSHEPSKEEKPKKLGEILLETNVLTEDQLEEALDSQEPPKLGEVLIEQKLATTEQVDNALASQKKTSSGSSTGGGSDTTIRVNTDRLDNVMNLVGELVLGRNRLLQLGASLAQTYEDNETVISLNETAAHINLVTTDLQQAVMKTRMQPIRRIFTKFPRMVRDLAREINKEIDFTVSGEDTELDRSVIESINDPLVHIIRNSVDHGIELPEEREAAGKARAGSLKLSAYYEGNNIVIEIRDDGKGIDPEVIKAKAISKGLVTEEEASRLEKGEIINFIFSPGFSTAQKVSDISGRGVGMDVVKTNIVKLSGLIDIDSNPGQGTVMMIKLPLTVAIIQTLMVGAGSREVFALPLSAVVEIVRISQEDIKWVGGKEVTRLRDRVLPLVKLGDIFNIPFDDSEEKWLYVVVIGLAEKNIGIIVEKLHGEEEVVIKSLGDYLDTKGIAGATILGNGRVTLIVDIPQFVELINEYQGSKQTTQKGSPVPSSPTSTPG